MIPKNNEMRFEVTTKCNYSCLICPRDRITRKIETMSLELFKKIFNKIIGSTDQYNTLTFPGLGEPLLDETLNKKIKYAKRRKKNLAVLLLTNGSLLSPQRFRQLEDLGVASVRVSFYGHDRGSYSRAHGIKNRAMFNRVRDNLVKITQIKTLTKLLLTFNLSDEHNEHCIQQWIGFWQDKADLLEVWRPHNWVDGRNYRKIQQERLNTCARPLKGPLQVQADGTVNMCCFDFDGKLLLGDLRSQSIKEVFSSGLYERIARCHQSGNFQGSGLICEDCDQRNKDKSGVMIYNSRFNIEQRVQMLSTTYQKII